MATNGGFEIDVLPPGCGVEGEVVDDVIRFRAVVGDERRGWSDWYPRRREVVLTWDMLVLLTDDGT